MMKLTPEQLKKIENTWWYQHKEAEKRLITMHIAFLETFLGLFPGLNKTIKNLEQQQLHIEKEITGYINSFDSDFYVREVDTYDQNMGQPQGAEGEGQVSNAKP